MIAELPDSRLEAIFVEEKYGTWFRNIHGSLSIRIIIWDKSHY